MEGMIWHNGVLQRLEEAGVSPMDHGLTVGDGVFETLLAPRGEAFAFRRHYERLQRSAERMGLAVPEAAELRSACGTVLAANHLDGKPARVRITVTGGEAPLGSERGEIEPTVLVACAPAPAMGPSATVVVVPFTRNERGALAGLKSTSYGENVVALAYARERGAGEAIFANTRGELCEGTGTNIFLVEGGVAVTPPLESGCLAGVTRSLVLELCEAESIPYREQALPIKRLQDCREAFLTSTTRRVQPIGAIDGRGLGGGGGAITARLREAFRRPEESTLDP